MLTILFVTILLQINFFLGYWLGSRQTDKPLEIKLPRITFKKKQLGAIGKVSQTDILKKGTRYEATEKAMVETLDKELGD